VAGGFLNKLLGRPAPSPDTAEALAELERLRQDRPSLVEPAALLAELLPLLVEPLTNVIPLSLPPGRASDKLAGGVPLLRGENVALDPGTLRRRWAAVCAAVGRYQERNATGALADAAKRGRLSIEELTLAVLAGRADEVHARADALGLDAGLAATVLRFTLYPSFVSLGEALAPLRAEIAWGRGLCPTCGSWPLLGEFRGLEQDRWLRCGLCASGWEFPRLACPFCDNRDHHRLGHLHIEGEESRRRASTCEECRGYVKGLATLGALSPPGLLVADLATVHLDLVAAERGYSMP
jgi:FdhE protein